MKTFNNWLIENHPEIVDEGIIDSLRKNKLLRNALVAGSLLTGSLGMSGSKEANAADSRPAATQKLPGTYQGGIRTHDEKGKAIKLSSADQKKVDKINSIRQQMSGGSSKVDSSPATKKSSDTIIRKTKSVF